MEIITIHNHNHQAAGDGNLRRDQVFGRDPRIFGAILGGAAGHRTSRDAAVDTLLQGGGSILFKENEKKSDDNRVDDGNCILTGGYNWI